jgi:hypothetical protein
VWGSEFTTKVSPKGESSGIFDLREALPSGTAEFIRNNHWKKCCRCVAGRAGEMRAIEPSMPPHVCPREGRWRPTTRIFAAGEVIDFALVTIYGLNDGSVRPRQGRRRPTPRFCAAGAGGVTAVQTCVGSGAPAAKLSANDSNPPKVHRREGKRRPAVHLPSGSFPAATASRRCLPWRTAMSTWPKQIFRDRTRPNPARFAQRSQLERLEGKTTSVFRSG